jgi:hypothetical protein
VSLTFPQPLATNLHNRLAHAILGVRARLLVAGDEESHGRMDQPSQELTTLRQRAVNVVTPLASLTFRQPTAANLLNR